MKLLIYETIKLIKERILIRYVNITTIENFKRYWYMVFRLILCLEIYKSYINLNKKFDQILISLIIRNVGSHSNYNKI